MIKPLKARAKDEEKEKT